MKTFLLISILLLIPTALLARTNTPNIDSLLHQARLELNVLRNRLSVKERELWHQEKLVEQMILAEKEVDQLIRLILKRDSLEQQRTLVKFLGQTEVRKIRYLKGIQIINLLYQKTLALDHHFSSVATLGEIHRISNPNNYPEFVRIRDRLSPEKKVKTGFDPEPILQSNVYTSVIYSVIQAFSKPKKEKELSSQNSQDLSCILDFTSRMHQDLKTVYYETFFLQRSNEIINQDMERLFEDFTRPIEYTIPLYRCYKEDLWEEIQDKLKIYVDSMIKLSDQQPGSSQLDRMQVELDFPIDRLMQFIYSYNSFIEQGTRFYEKFGAMLGDYQNQDSCQDQLPVAYLKLKDQIEIAIHKFRTAYRPVEINGSKFKELLYGLSEYD